ncbi:phosphotransferase enzyme family protein [Salinisphaera dokdonensis CL-ES53]|uniref:Phosphotransferase enzyme family protein n=1 Tax=Salinisphaera dokdonensis CL-ES53 TaxID=1304272 RepID=A0ABV2AYX2_9GAMM
MADTPLTDAHVRPVLQALAEQRVPGAQVEQLTRLTGGASQPMWSFDLASPAGVEALVLRLTGTISGADEGTLALADEARLLELMAAHDVPVPGVWQVLDAHGELGAGYIMQRIDGETLPQRILRDDAYADARHRLARECGQVLAAIHRVPTVDAPYLQQVSVAQWLDRQYREYRSYREPRPVFELAFQWLRQNLPREPAEPALVHGDFRNGNLMINRHGLRAVLDWEMAHIGDPMADLGWLCVDSWRFGEIDHPVGGFGSREQLFAGYEEASGVTVCPETVWFWEVFGCLKWGIICQKMARSFSDGTDRTVERGAIGRRASETEIDLLARLAPLAS